MQKKGHFENIFILVLICLILLGSVSLDTVFSYFSDKTGTEGNTTMGYIELVSLTNLDGSEIGDAQTLDSDQTFTGEYKLITNTNINYYVYIFLKGTITPDGDKTHDSSCSDYYADDTDCLDITVNGYSKLDTKADGYTIYYKLCPIQTAGQNTQTFSISASIKSELVENGCDYYDNATILFDMKVKTKQADYLQANEYTLGFSSPLVNKDLCSIGFVVPIKNVSKYPELTFTIVDSNTKTVSIAPADKTITEVHIPHQVEMNGEVYTITSVPDSAFIDCTNLTTVTIDEGIESIGNSAFYDCNNLTSITLPDSLTEIGGRAFMDCLSLTTVTLPNNLESIGESAFYCCTSLTAIDIPISVTSIGRMAFATNGMITSGATITYDGTVEQMTSIHASGGGSQIVYTITCSDGIFSFKVCLWIETEIDCWDDKKKRRYKKKLKDITYDDDILVWDFDNGCFATAKAMYITRPKYARSYSLLTFSDGSTLKTIGASNQKRHRIFNVDTGRFEYSGHDLKVGTRVFNSKGEIVTVTSNTLVKEKIEYMNVVTKRHFNMFANGILTSFRSNNMYEIKDMKYIKDDRPIFENTFDIDDETWEEMRLGEQFSMFGTNFDLLEKFRKLKTISKPRE